MFDKCEHWFGKFAHKTAKYTGKSFTFVLAFLLILVWAITGPMFNYSDTWQLVINTTTTIITFLMVFVIQNSQNSDGTAIQAKLDELLSVTDGARKDLERIEDLDEKQIEAMRRRNVR